jgi:hypothetical protein
MRSREAATGEQRGQLGVQKHSAATSDPADPCSQCQILCCKHLEASYSGYPDAACTYGLLPWLSSR